MSRAPLHVTRRLDRDGHGTALPDPGCEVAAQCVMAGPQDHRVQGGNAQATGRGHGVISIRVGRMLIYLEDREALQSWTRAMSKAIDMQDAAFGPELPEPAVRAHRPAEPIAV